MTRLRNVPRFLLLSGLALALAGCWGGPHIDTLEAPTLPPPMVIVMTMTAGPSPDPLTVTAPPTVALATLAATPELSLFCTTDGVRLRSDASTSAEILVEVGARTSVSRIGTEERQGEGYTWYNVDVGGTRGWMAAGWLAAGDCNAAASGGETPTIVDTAYVSGYDWEETGSLGETHYGIDINSSSGDTNIYAAYDGTIAASDACATCTEDDPEAGNAQGETGEDYNYGYGAMAIVEYAYADLTQADLDALAEDGIDLQQGQSAYLMFAHLDPSSVPNDGSAFDAGGDMGNIGNSGNSYGAHSHVEAAINDSGLRPEDDDNTAEFWWDTIVERARAGDQGGRIDPSPIFDIPE